MAQVARPHPASYFEPSTSSTSPSGHQPNMPAHNIQPIRSTSPEKRSIGLSPLCPEQDRHKRSVSFGGSSSLEGGYPSGSPPLHPMRAQHRPAVRSSSGPIKGKGRDGTALTAEKERKTASWVVDTLQAQRGREMWSERERVVLILGDVTIDALAPILYNPSFNNTLLLIGTSDPIPSIQALTSPSYLMRNPDQQIFPTVQPFSLPEGMVAQQQLPAILEIAQDKSRSFRNAARKAHSRRPSHSSAISANSGTLTPPPRILQSSMFGFNRRDSHGSLASMALDSPTASRPGSMFGGTEFTRSASDQYLSARRDSQATPTRGRLTSFRSESIFGGLAKLADLGPQGSSGPSAPFDAVINFIPGSTDRNIQASLQTTLHQAVLVTTGVLPILHRRASDAAFANTGLPITIAHIVPRGCPAPMPMALEKYLLDFTPNFQGSERAIWACATNRTVWRTSVVDEMEEEAEEGEMPASASVSGAEALLFGGARCPTDIVRKQQAGDKMRGQAYLASWNLVMPIPGLLGTVSTASAVNRPSSQVSRDSSATAVPPVSAAPSAYQNLRPAYPRTAYETETNSLSSTTSASVPELDSPSTCSSVSGEVETTPLPSVEESEVWRKSRYGLSKELPAAPAIKQKKSFMGWLRKKTGKA